MFTVLHYDSLLLVCVSFTIITIAKVLDRTHSTVDMFTVLHYDSLLLVCVSFTIITIVKVLDRTHSAVDMFTQNFINASRR